MSKRPGRFEAAHTSWCEQHAKVLYRDRKSAKANVRKNHQRMRAYECTATPGLYHVGHLPAAVHYGIATTSEVYGGVA